VTRVLFFGGDGSDREELGAAQGAMRKKRKYEARGEN
jgi:hypothetical protein